LCNMNEPTRQHIPKQTDKIKTTKIVYPQIYSYTLPELAQNEGSQKIGYTERENVDDRIREQTHTAAVKLKAEKQWSAPSFFSNSKEDFKDKIFHDFLKKNDIENRTDLGTEWFYFNGTPEKSKELFDAFRDQGFAALQTSEGKISYTMRAEQDEAVTAACEYFNANENGEFLWNAKPRFGKTLSTYDLARQLTAKKVLIVTNRPAIANSWFDDFEQFIDGYHFISETSSLAERRTISRDQYNSLTDKKPFIAFLSLQDLKGSRYFGGNHDKLRWIADLDWDLLVIDEAHEGIDTERTDRAFDFIKRNHTLHLSGTPFKALANNKFPTEAIFNWTYLDEQRKKREELEVGESGDHVDIPDLKLFTYRISQMTAEAVNEGIEIDDEARDYAFDLNEFFATKNQKFIHEEDVKNFLTNLSTNTKYPFSTPELRDQLRHTFWYVGNRVESVKALEQLLKQDPVFKNYKVVVAAGDGRSFEEEEADFKNNEKSFDKVKKAIAENPRTITLSCGQLTTGVTIKEWSAVLMLTDIKSTPLYMQAAFRAQNPYKFIEDDQLKAKQSAYLFDFAPTRVLEMYEQFANGLNSKASQGKITESERKENVRKLLNYFPVISEDTEGRMVELAAEMVLTFPNALAATEIVKARFMTNLLFNDNIKGVFHFPQEVEDILDKMPIEKNKRAEKTKSTLDLGDARKVEQTKQTKINENSNVILGDKIFRANMERVVDNVLNYETPEETLDSLPGQLLSIAETPIAIYKNTYHKTNSETEDLRSEFVERVKQRAAEFETDSNKDPEALKDDVASILEELVHKKVEQEETKVVEQVKKTKEEEVRDHLRAFTRTIPMFIMANSSKETITIENFDEEISDDDFIDLTNITKAEFYKLRDGFEYDQDGERKHFQGVFDTYKFNASIAEFVAEKKQRADYFKTDEDIFELIPNQKNNQIFTPRKVVKMMVDGLEKEQPDLFRRTDSTFIDLYMKSGMYITEIVKKLFANTRHKYGSDSECLKHILENQVYGLAPTGVLHGITTSYILGFDAGHTINVKNFVQHDLLPQAKDGTAAQKLRELYNGGNMMKFDAVVGNPPYQESTGDNKTQATPLYNKFIESAKSLNPQVISMITPSRWFNGGIGLNSFRGEMINDRRLRSINDYSNAKDCFPDVSIGGGVNFFLWDSSYNGKCTFTNVYKNGSVSADRYLNEFGFVVRDNSALSTIYKVRDIANASLSSLVSSLNPFGIASSFRGGSNVTSDGVTVHTSGGAVRANYSDIKSGKEYINAYKVMVSKTSSEHAGEPDKYGQFRVLSKVQLLDKGEVCSFSYFVIGQFESEYEGNALVRYLNTKLVRFLILQSLTSINLSQDKFQLVPVQNFNRDSDIDWSKSISEIDQQLYRKYGLNQEEIDFIESKVKPMA